MTIPIKNYSSRSIFIELIDHSAIFFFLTIHIIFSKLFNLRYTVFQQFKIHSSRKNIYLKLFGLICKNFNSKTLTTDIISILILPKQITVGTDMTLYFSASSLS